MYPEPNPTVNFTGLDVTFLCPPEPSNLSFPSHGVIVDMIGYVIIFNHPQPTFDSVLVRDTLHGGGSEGRWLTHGGVAAASAYAAAMHEDNRLQSAAFGSIHQTDSETFLLVRHARLCAGGKKIN